MEGLRHRLQLLCHAGVRIYMNTFSKSLVALAVGGLMIAGSAAAQNTTSNTSGAGPGVVDPGHPRVNQVNRREQRQQNRIANGMKNDKLSSKQASHLEHREANLQKTEQKDMAKHNGHLTKAEQRNLNHRENHISKSIYKDKHSKK